MITISLDEQGVFEKNDQKNGDLVFIAGIIFDDNGDEKETIRESETAINNLICYMYS